MTPENVGSKTESRGFYVNRNGYKEADFFLKVKVDQMSIGDHFFVLENRVKLLVLASYRMLLFVRI